MANPGHRWHAEGARDFNGDGNADILWQDDGADGGTPAIWLMNGTSIIGGGTVGPGDRPGTSRGPATSTATARPTFSGRTMTARLAIWLMNGTSSLEAGV